MIIRTACLVKGSNGYFVQLFVPNTSGSKVDHVLRAKIHHRHNGKPYIEQNVRTLCRHFLEQIAVPDIAKVKIIPELQYTFFINDIEFVPVFTAGDYQILTRYPITDEQIQYMDYPDELLIQHVTGLATNS